MQLVINIPDDDFFKISEINKGQKIILDNENVAIIFRLIKAVKNGTPLPKEHGRLVDVNDVKTDHNKWRDYLDDDMVSRMDTTLETYVPTIIEATKE